MKEKAIMASTLFTVLLVGVIGAIGLTAQETGMTIQTTSSIRQGGCCCEIEMYDYYGNPIGTQVQTLRGVSGMARTDDACNNRCDIYFGKSKRGRKSVEGHVC